MLGSKHGERDRSAGPVAPTHPAGGVRPDEVDAGLFQGEHIELIRGAIVTMSPIGVDHSFSVQELSALFIRALAGRAVVKIQSPFAASDDSEPEPDVAVYPPGDYRKAHPSKAWLIIEVASSSLAVDKGPKAALYAASGVEEYWVVDLVSGLVLVHTDIAGGAYARLTPFRSGEIVRPARFPDVEVPVAAILAT